MKVLIPLCSLLISSLFSAQIGIGTENPDVSAALDVKSSSRGVLFPNLNETQMNAIANPVTGLLIYNTDKKGFYAYDGSRWSQESFMPAGTWGADGNKGITAANYIGTSNNNDFNIRTNNKQVISVLRSKQVRLEGDNIQSSRLYVKAARKNVSNPPMAVSNSNGFGGVPLAISYSATNDSASGSVIGNYAFAAGIDDAEAGRSSAGMSYIQDADVKGISFYTGGHPSDISDRGKEAMIITDDTTNRNVGIGVHIPKSKLQLGGDLYISDPSKGLIIRDSSGGCHRITVANGGGLVTSGTIACP